MSYINDALRKAQKENKSSWTTGAGIASAEDKKPDVWRKGYTIIGLSVVFFFAAGIMVVLYWSDFQPGRRSAPVILAPPAATAAPAEAQIPPDPPPFQAMAAPESSAPAGANTPAASDITTPPIQTQALPAEVKADQPEETSKPVVGRPDKSEAAPPADPKRLYARALKMQRNGKLDEATELYRQVLEQEPRNIQALNNLGVVHLKMKRYRRAIIRFNEALTIQHDYADAHYNLACLYAKKSDLQKSLFYLKNAITLNPEARGWAADDTDLKGLAQLHDFQKLMQARDN